MPVAVDANGIFTVISTIRGTTLSSTGGMPAFSADGLRIVYADGGVMVMNSDGSGKTRLTTGDDYSPQYSPNGDRIVFSSDRGHGPELYMMKADGSNQTQLTAEAGVASEPSWSPDGSKIAYTCGSATSICTIHPDGSSRAVLGSGWSPDFSPDGSSIAFSDNQPGFDECEAYVSVFIMNPDGSDRFEYTGPSCAPLGDSLSYTEPVWAPDGSQIAVNFFHESFGEGEYQASCAISPFGPSVSNEDCREGLIRPREPAWQPVVDGAYPRPQAATPLYAPLVPAYRGCPAPNRVHAEPLGVPSCNPPDRASDVLTVGTPDANANSANFTGSARYRVISGDPGTPLDEADVALDVSLTDVRCAITSATCPDGPNSDYTGRLLLIAPPLQVTDKDGQPATGGHGAATGTTNFPVPFDCTPTLSTTIGSSCSISTTADALLPNVIKEGHRAIWESGPVHVRDPGPNGTGFGAGCPPTCGDGDETLFLRQGIFVP